jgi:hypothetical protein
MYRRIILKLILKESFGSSGIYYLAEVSDKRWAVVNKVMNFLAL